MTSWTAAAPGLRGYFLTLDRSRPRLRTFHPHPTILSGV